MKTQNFKFFTNPIRGFTSLSPPQLIICSFAIIIAIGTFLLCLPWATVGDRLSLVNGLFTAVSATCVTGLTVVDIGTELTLFGQLVVLSLIQVGGLGIMTFSTFFLYLLGRRVSFRGREIIGSTLSHRPVQSIGSLLWKIMLIVFFMEGVGVCLLTFAWSQYYSLSKAIYHGIFHAISAFCNAGFSLYSNSFEGFQLDLMINFVTMGLIVLGGLGFVVLLDLKALLRGPRRGFRNLSFHSKVVLTTTLFLILLGTLFIFWVERAHGFRQFRIGSGLLMALFQSVTARTAGFNTVPIDSLTNGVCFIIAILMFIGGAPGSCAGGVKVSTLGILVAIFVSRLRGYEEPQLFFRSISRETAGKALTIVLSSVLLISIAILGLLLTEDWSMSPDESRGHFIKLVFETISAFGTVGLSMGVTSQLTTTGRLFIILLMFVGRLGPLTMAIALTRRKPVGRFRYAKGEIMVG